MINFRSFSLIPSDVSVISVLIILFAVLFILPVGMNVLLLIVILCFGLVSLRLPGVFSAFKAGQEFLPVKYGFHRSDGAFDHGVVRFRGREPLKSESRFTEHFHDFVAAPSRKLDKLI